MSKKTFTPIFKVAIIVLIVTSFFIITGEELSREITQASGLQVSGLQVETDDPANDSINDAIILTNMANNKDLSYNLPNKPAYILRLDDVQTPAWSNISMQIINDTLNRNQSITIAIIPSRNQHDPCDIIDYIKVHKDDPHLEIAQHGYIHSYYEYDNLSISEVQPMTMKGLRQLYHDYNMTPVTFIPPNNEITSYNNSTADVLCDMGFRILSSAGDICYEGNILDYGYTINYGSKSTQIDGEKLNDTEEIVNACEKDFERQNLSVIMIHPQDFVKDDDRKTLDPVKYGMYLEMLDELNNTGAQSITFRDLLR